MALSDMPEDLIVSTLLKVLETGFRQFCRAKATCRRMREVADTPEFCRSVDFYYMRVPWTEHWPSDAFKLQCLQHNNPSALLLKGVSEFFYEGNTVEGLVRIKRASSIGWDTAIYIYSMMIKTLFNAEDGMRHEFRLTRESAYAIRRAILTRDRRVWPYQVCAILTEARDNISISQIKKCGCAEYDNWRNWWDDDVKKGVMCEDCFWTIESLFFCKIITDHFSRWP